MIIGTELTNAYTPASGPLPQSASRNYNDKFQTQINELIKEKLGGKIESSFPSLFHAIIIPINDPIINDTTSEIPTNNNVHPKLDNIMDETCSGK